jgi:phospholipid/cholesterol/gamma-HCH transport system ATP-binding protein
VSAEYIVELENVSFAYDARPIMDGITLRVPRGQVVAIMGASGSGKTTVLRLIGGTLRPSGGTVKAFDRKLNGMRTSELYSLRRKMGMLFQFGALFTDLTAYENVAFPMRELTDMPETMIRDLVLMKLEAVGLRGAAHFRPQQLSGGMARRVALARTTALDPELIMYDEPFTGLDPISLAVTGKLIRDLNSALGATSIIVTHDVHESLQLVDHIYFVSEGRIVADGTPAEVLASKDPFVHQFVHAEADGPVPFHYPERRDYRRDLLTRIE